jgi:hypothetical protein
MSLTDEQAEKLNRAAIAHLYEPPAQPGDGPDYPCIEIGGVMVFAYVDPQRGLRISVHLDEAQAPLLHDGRLVPLEFDVIGTTPVYRADERGIETYPLLARDAEDARAAAARVGQQFGAIAGGPIADTVGELHGLTHVLADRVLGR